MAVTESKLGGYTPLCNCCGVSLCWEIGPHEYEEAIEFWDEWTCKSCNPNYEGALKRFMENKTVTKE